MADTDNPFDQVFDALWDMVEDSVPLQTLLKERNKIKFNKPNDRDTQKQNVQAGDLPELTLLSDGAPVTNLHFSSCGAMIRRAYSFVLSTGDYRINLSLNKVQFALQCSLFDTSNRLASLTWRGNQFVKRVDWDSLVDGLSDQELNRGIKGWSSIWSCLIEMHIAQKDLRDFNQGIG